MADEIDDAARRVEDVLIRKEFEMAVRGMARAWVDARSKALERHDLVDALRGVSIEVFPNLPKRKF